MSWEEYRNVAWLCRDGVGKAKERLELDLAGDAQNNKKGFTKGRSCLTKPVTFYEE